MVLQTRLQSLTISRAHLAGALPDGMIAWKRVQHVNLGNVPLAGPIPDAVSGMTSLKHFCVSYIKLQGALPEGLAGWHSLIKLQLLGFGVTGSLPKMIAAWSALRQLETNEAKLEGSLPAGLWSLRALERLCLGYTSLRGALPDAITSMSALEIFWWTPEVAGSGFAGTLPEALCLLTDIERVVLPISSLEGGLPVCLQSLQRLKIFRAQWSGLQGTIPDRLLIKHSSGFKWLLLRGNDLTGSVPEGLFPAQPSTILDISENLLEGPLALHHRGLLGVVLPTFRR